MRILKKTIGIILIIMGLILVFSSLGMIIDKEYIYCVILIVISIILFILGGKLVKSARKPLSENEIPTIQGSFKDFLVKYKTGVAGMIKPTSCIMRITDNRIEFIKKGRVQGAVNLASISGVDVYKESELIAAIEKNKSVVGRAVAGTVLLGLIGTILGGMSGIGTKTVRSAKEKKTWFFAFTHTEQGITDTALVEILGFSNEKNAYRAKNELLSRMKAGIKEG